MLTGTSPAHNHSLAPHASSFRSCPEIVKPSAQQPRRRRDGGIVRGRNWYSKPGIPTRLINASDGPRPCPALTTLELATTARNNSGCVQILLSKVSEHGTGGRCANPAPRQTGFLCPVIHRWELRSALKKRTLSLDQENCCPVFGSRRARHRCSKPSQQARRISGPLHG